ncbi:unnamed protein product [Bursaphelenchus okinawaensis]|uniref:Transporter n=1 Tax=Bursaphelenchus okinawaensis TaxID=465554 RepID=A0A811LR36_9BILA|nr:unnamed protein product [Bursaphelenchus okinawaensis]CAG9127967.1 unnamed protein product [Bursaphelenchus okinawaensis]
MGNRHPKSSRSDEDKKPQVSVEEHVNLETADEEIRRLVKMRFQKQDWAMGRGVVEEEMLVTAFELKTLKSSHVIHDFDRAVVIKSVPTKESLHHSRSVSNIMLCITYGLSSHNLLDFPYFCYKHGGITFFIPYIIVLIFFAIPMLFIEIGLGQFYQKPATHIFAAMNFSYTGVGLAIVLVSFLKLFWNLKVVSISMFMAMRGIESWFQEKNVWNECIQVSTSNCYDFLLQERCYALKYNEFDEQQLDPATEEKCKYFYKYVTRANFSGAHGMSPIIMNYLNTYAWAVPPKIDDLVVEYGEPLYIMSAAFAVSVIFMVVGVRRVAVIPLGMLKVASIASVIWIYIFLARAPLTEAGKELFYTLAPVHLLDGQTWADAVQMAIVTLSMCDGSLHAIGRITSFNHRYWTSVAVLLIVNVALAYFCSLTLICAVSILTEQLFHQANGGNIEGRIHEYMVHGSIVTWSAVPEAINSFGLSGPYHLVPIYYLCICFMSFPGLVINMAKMYQAVKESAISVYIMDNGEFMFIKRLALLFMMIIFLLPSVFLLAQSWSVVLARLLSIYSINVSFMIGVAELGIIAYLYDGTKFYIDIFTMHTKLPFITAIIFLILVVISPFVAFSGLCYHMLLNRVMRIVDYVVPVELHLTTSTTMVIAFLIMIAFPFRNMVNSLYHGYSLRNIWQIQATWVPLRKADGEVARGNRLAFRRQNHYSKCAVAKTDVRNLTKQ